MNKRAAFTDVCILYGSFVKARQMHELLFCMQISMQDVPVLVVSVSESMINNDVYNSADDGAVLLSSMFASMEMCE